MDFEQIKKEHPERIKRISQLENAYKRAEMLINLQESPIFREIIDELNGLVDTINSSLLLESTTEAERTRLFAQREAWKWLLNKFNMAENTINTIEERIKKI